MLKYIRYNFQKTEICFMERIAAFEKVSFDHVPRELNRLADAQVNKALDAQLQTTTQHV